MTACAECGINQRVKLIHADLAQLVEQRIRNAQVVSSSLTVGSIKKFQASMKRRGFRACNIKIFISSTRRDFFVKKFSANSTGKI